MESTGTTLSLETKPAALTAAVGGFVDGALELNDLRDALVKEIQDDPTVGGSIQELLESELEAGRLTVKDYTELVEGINTALSESVPTEASEEAPDKPGFYNIDHEGTLILSEDDGENDETSHEAKDSAEDSDAAEEVDEIKVGSVLLDRYRLDEEIARGSMGMVYKAVDLKMLEEGTNDPRVAIKLISPEYVSHQTALKTFENEIANTRHLDHPNIVKLYALENEDEKYFISMEWLEGEALDELLGRSEGSALPPVQTYAIIEQLCDALAYAHSNDVVHADVKPGNVFLVKTGELKLIDFGIASIDPSAQREGTPADFGGVALTPAYASCERLEKEPATVKDDLFSLACMVYRLLAGRRVFGSMNALEAEQKGVEPVPIGEMDAARWSALRQALAFRREDRQASVQDFADAFKPQEPAEDTQGEPEKQSSPAAISQAQPEELSGEDLIEIPADNEDLAAETPLGATELSESADEPEETYADTTLIENLDGTIEVVNANVDEDPSTIVQAQLDEDPSTIVQAQLEEGIGDTELLESFADFRSLDASSLSKQVSDTTKIEALNETSESLPLGGDSNPAPVAGKDNASPLELSLESETGEVKAAPEPVPKAPPADISLFDDPVADATPLPGTVAIAEEEVATVNTSGIDELPDPINIHDGDGSGLLPEDVIDPTVTLPDTRASAPGGEITVPQDVPDAPGGEITLAQDAVSAPTVDATIPHDQVSVPGGEVSVPADGAAAKPRLKIPKARIRQVSKKTAADDAAPVIPQHSREKATKQLQGEGQKQVYGDNRVEKLRAWITRLQRQPRMLAVVGGGVALVLALIVTLVMLLGSESEPVPVEKTSAAPADIQIIAPEDPDAPIMLDLSAPAESSAEGSDIASTAGAQQSLADGALFGSPEPVAPVPMEVIVVAPAEPQLIESAAPSAFVIGMHSKAEQALKAGRLTEPGKNSFVYWIERLRTEGGDMPMIRTLEVEAVGMFISRSEDAYIKGDMAEASKWADLAEKYGASKNELAPVRASISKYKKSNPGGKPKTKANAVPKRTEKLKPVPVEVKQKPAPEEQMDQVLIGRFQTVTMSKLEFTRFVDPRYPSGSDDRSLSGWVDVAFTVDKTGRPQNILVTGSNLPTRFEPPAIAAVKSWRFMPYAPSGKPVVVNTAVRMRYDRPTGTQ